MPARTAVAVVFALVALGACGDGADDPPPSSAGGPVTTTTGGGLLEAGGPVEAVALGAGLAADLPAGAEVTPLAEADAQPGGPGCSALQGRISIGDAHVELWHNSSGCTGEQADQIGNGFHGIYVTIDDVPAPVDVEERSSAAGDVVTFTQEYFECTNECNDYEDTVAVLALDAPPDPDRPTVVLLSPKGAVAVEDLARLAGAVRPE